SYTWNISLTGSDITVAPTLTTTYTVTGVNASGCSGTGQAIVTVNSKPGVTATGGTICNGGNINISANNATTYTWNTGSSSNPYNVNPTTATTYTVTGTNGNGCTNTSQAVVTVNPKPNITATGGSTCAGSPICITASNGVSYTWNTNFVGSSLNVSPTINTTYTVTGTDVNGCTNSTIAAVTINPSITISTTDKTICNGSTTIISASNGTLYTWSTGALTSDITVSPNNTITYYVTGINAQGCTGTGQAVVTVNPKPNVTATGGIICNGNILAITASGASSYAWSGGLGAGSSITVNPGVNITYFVTGTDANSCTNTAEAVVIVNPLPNITATGGSTCAGSPMNVIANNGNSFTWNTGFVGNPLNVTPVVNTTYSVTGTDNNGCTNTAEATVTINATISINTTNPAICNGNTTIISAYNGTQYTWETGATISDITVNPTTTTTYLVTGINAQGCSGTGQAVVTVNNLPNVTATGGTICNGDNINIIANNATTYTWNTGSNNNPYNVNPNTTTTYSVTGTDNNGCTNSTQVTVAVNALPNVTASGATICNGNNIDITAINAITYTWNTGSNNNPYNVNPNQSTTYTVTGTDNNSCTNTAQAIVTVNQKPNITANGTTICNGANASITASGGTSYTWSTSFTGNPLNVAPTITTTYSVTGTDMNGCTNSTQLAVAVNALPNIIATGGTICNGNDINITANNGITYTWNTGSNDNPYNITPNQNTTYTVTGIDNNSCTNTAEALVNINPLPNVTAAGGSMCENSSFAITASGANTYIWNDGTTINPKTVSPKQTTSYTVTGTDNNSCTNVASCNVCVMSALILNVFPSEICNGGTATISATNGSSYTWNTGATTSTLTVSPTVTATYYVTGTNINGCTATSFVSVTVNPNPQVNVADKAVCFGVAVTLNATGNGGTTPYNYNWSPATGLNQTTGQTVTANPAITTIYTVTITDNKGCVGTNTVNVGISPQMTAIIINKQDATCSQANGNATVNASGGTPYTTGMINYNCLWSNGATTPTINNLKAGTYTVTVTDSLECTATTTVTIGDTPPLTLTLTTTPEHCNRADGTATATANAQGGSNYTYVWNTGDTTKTINKLTEGIYTVTVKGTCKITGTTTVNETSGPQADFTYTPSILDIFENTTALFEDLSTSGGQQIVKWQWNFYDDNSISYIKHPTHTYQEPGTYTVCLKVTDSENCTDLICKPIVVKDIFTIYIPNAFSPNGDLLNEGFIPKGYRIDPNDFKMLIFNRWGEEIYKTTNFNTPWNGRYMNKGDLVQVGVYVYRITIKELDGPKHEYIGRVSVIR
ncbi:MAG: gliding motility-associated C-terminal domain-containing protein, partial [Bacteroidales bacterium]